VSGRHDEVERLLHEMKNGSVAAFEQFYERFVSQVFQLALRMLGDRMEAEDICHDIFLEIYRKADQFDPQRGSIEAWLAVKTRTRCLDRLRRKKPELYNQLDETLLRQEGTAAPTEERVFAKLERDTVREAMNQLPDAQREAVFGMYFLSQSHRELSKRMERPLGTIKSLVRYGLINVRKQLCQLGWMEQPGGAKERE
jgi:RNA polymerase sigma-70 factor (ECF subfamily)